MAQKPKMHQLLTVESDLKSAFTKILAETKVTFTKRTAHFDGQIKKHEYLSDEDQEKMPKVADEHQALTTTVQQKLDYQAKSVVKFFDFMLQKESTNQIAVADLVVDGTVLIENAPATFLLGMEDKLSKLREAYATIPTYTPGIHWDKSPEQGEGVYEARYPEERFQTVTKEEPVILYPHQFPKEGEKGEALPAQIQTFSKTNNIGRYKTTKWTGRFSPTEKSEMLTRLDKLLMAVKKARTRANNAEVVKRNESQKLLDFIHGKI